MTIVDTYFNSVFMWPFVVLKHENGTALTFATNRMIVYKFVHFGANYELFFYCDIFFSDDDDGIHIYLRTKLMRCF